eukprot:g10685.t1
MTVLYEGSRTLLANSKVRRSSAYRETSEDANGYSPKSTKSVEVDVAVKSVALNEDDCDLAMMRRECEILNRLGAGPKCFREIQRIALAKWIFMMLPSNEGHSHPHIMPALGFAEFASEMVLLMRFASEGDLSRLAPSGSCFEEIQA